jgi:prepilin-type processing-associated H-X9-DG protein
VTWEGARDRLQGLAYTAAYTKPHHLDPEFIKHVPNQGTIFRYIKKQEVYTCPTDKPGKAQDTPVGGGGNGRLSYSMNAYIGYQDPGRLQSFRYVADSLNNPLPDGQKKRSFKAGQRIVFPAAGFMLLFEEHPYRHINTSFPEGNFNGLDQIATRHMPTAGSAGLITSGRTSIVFLDGHAEGRTYPAKTQGRELFTEFGQPDKANMSAFIKQLKGSCPW